MPAHEACPGEQLSSGRNSSGKAGTGSAARPSPAPAWAQRACDVLAGLTLMAWAVEWAWAAVCRPDWVLPTMAVFQAWVGGLLLARSPVATPPRWIDVVLSGPSLLVSGLTLKLAPDPSTWPAWNSVLFVAGAAWAMASLGWLGRSFAIFPALRAARRQRPLLPDPTSGLRRRRRDDPGLRVGR